MDGLQIPVEPEAVARGQELVKGLAACGFCHGAAPDPSAPLTGGRKFYDLYGEVNSPNLTPAASGLKDWSVIEIMKGIKSAQGRDETLLSAEAHSSYEWMSDRDTLAIIAYLRALPAVENEVERRSVSSIDRNTKGFFESRSDDVSYVPEIDRRHAVQYGGYLVDHVARCVTCHNGPTSLFGGAEYLAGGTAVRIEEGEKLAPGIGPSPEDGLGQWSEADIINYLKSGHTPRADETDAKFCPTRFYAKASQRDLEAIAKFLKSLK